MRLARFGGAAGTSAPAALAPVAVRAAAAADVVRKRRRSSVMVGLRFGVRQPPASLRRTAGRRKEAIFVATARRLPWNGTVACGKERTVYLEQRRTAAVVFLVLAAAAPSAEPPVDFQWGVRIPLRDGVTLNATVYRPRDQKDRLPAIFTLTPYVGDTYHARAA